MNDNRCVNSRMSKSLVGLVFLGFSFIIGISGLTLLPVIGFVFAVPFLVIAIYFFSLHLNKECEFSP